jgi:hypothetical protein
MVEPHRLWMCSGPLLLGVTDMVVTFCEQPAQYWGEGYQVMREHNPLANWLLAVHPAAFLGGNLIWMCCFSLAILFLPPGMARVVAFVVMVGHALAVSTWLSQHPFGLLWIALLLAIPRRVAQPSRTPVEQPR